MLGGYSQGAAVVDMLAGVPPLGNRIGEIGSAPPLPGSHVGFVAAVAVFGNPATKFGNPLTTSASSQAERSTCARTAILFVLMGETPSPTAVTRMRWLQQAASFAAGRV